MTRRDDLDKLKKISLDEIESLTVDELKELRKLNRRYSSTDEISPDKASEIDRAIQIRLKAFDTNEAKVEELNTQFELDFKDAKRELMSIAQNAIREKTENRMKHPTTIINQSMAKADRKVQELREKLEQAPSTLQKKYSDNLDALETQYTGDYYKQELITHLSGGETYLKSIRSAREYLGMSKSAFAKKLGISPRALSRYESGERVMPRYIKKGKSGVPVVQNLCEALAEKIREENPDTGEQWAVNEAKRMLKGWDVTEGIDANQAKQIRQRMGYTLEQVTKIFGPETAKLEADNDERYISDLKSIATSHYTVIFTENEGCIVDMSLVNYSVAGTTLSNLGFIELFDVITGKYKRFTYDELLQANFSIKAIFEYAPSR